jgi:hypothetical protein
VFLQYQPGNRKAWRRLLPLAICVGILGALAIIETRWNVRRCIDLTLLQRRCARMASSYRVLLYERTPSAENKSSKERNPNGIVVSDNWSSPWLEFRRELGLPPRGSGVLTLYAAYRSAGPSDPLRLLVVERNMDETPDALQRLQIYIVQPGTVTKAPMLLWRGSLGDNKNIVRVWNGTSDPRNGGHFFIECETDSGPDALEGWLMEDGGVEMQYRSGTGVFDGFPDGSDRRPRAVLSAPLSRTSITTPPPANDEW